MRKRYGNACETIGPIVAKLRHDDGITSYMPVNAGKIRNSRLLGQLD